MPHNKIHNGNLKLVFIAPYWHLIVLQKAAQAAVYPTFKASVDTITQTPPPDPSNVDSWLSPDSTVPGLLNNSDSIGLFFFHKMKWQR